MKNYDLIQARNGTIAQFEGQDGQPKAVTGDHGPYYQLVDVKGNPLFSENNPAHVQLTGSIVEEITYKDITVTAGSVYTITEIDLDGARIGIGVRLLESGLFEVRQIPNAPGTGTAIGAKTVIKHDTATLLSSVSSVLEHRRHNIAFFNNDSKDLKIRYLVITVYTG